MSARCVASCRELVTQMALKRVHRDMRQQHLGLLARNGEVFDLMGVANIVFSTDFPHPDCNIRARSHGSSSSRCPMPQSARSSGTTARGTTASRDQRLVRGCVSRLIGPLLSGSYS